MAAFRLAAGALALFSEMKPREKLVTPKKNSAPRANGSQRRPVRA
jgi:hypothetical protein